jgi:hypothetical protein
MRINYKLSRIITYLFLLTGGILTILWISTGVRLIEKIATIIAVIGSIVMEIISRKSYYTSHEYLTKLVKETLYVLRLWSGSIAYWSYLEILEFIKNGLKNPIHIKKRIARKVKSKVNVLIQQYKHNNTKLSIGELSRFIEDFTPHPTTVYLSEIKKIPAKKLEPILETEYYARNEHAGDEDAYNVLQIIFEVHLEELARKISKERILTFNDNSEPFLATYKLAKKFMMDDFELWYQSIILDKESSNLPYGDLCKNCQYFLNGN